MSVVFPNNFLLIFIVSKEVFFLKFGFYSINTFDISSQNHNSIIKIIKSNYFFNQTKMYASSTRTFTQVSSLYRNIRLIKINI